MVDVEAVGETALEVGGMKFGVLKAVRENCGVTKRRKPRRLERGACKIPDAFQAFGHASFELIQGRMIDTHEVMAWCLRIDTLNCEIEI